MELVRHLSIRVPWHDRGWDGHVCNQPLENSACLALKLIATRRRDDVESRIAQEAFEDLPHDEVPPCLRSSGTFLSPRAHAFESVMAYSPWSDDHKHLQPRTVHVPAWGALVIPYRWMLKESGFQQAKLLELDAHPEAEPTQPEWLTNTNWVQSHANQLALLEAFAAPIVEGESLVLFYTTRTPLCDDERRVLIGGALLNKKHDLVEYPSQGGELRAMVWERGIQHTLRPDPKSDGFTNGFVMPYREVMEVLASRSELDAKDFVAFAPDDVRAQFSYGSEQVSHGAAAAALLAARAALGRIGEVLSGPWDRYVAWIDDRLSRLWKLQGPAPGLGVVLSALHTGFNGTLFAMALSDELAENADPWPVVDKIFSGKRKPPVGSPAVTSMLQKRWAKIKASEEKLDSLKLLARMELTREQAERGIEVDVAGLLDNPYRLYELDRTNKEPTPFGIVDRGVYPGAEVASAHSLPDRCNPVLAEYDNSLRLRAACVQILEEAADQGHTLLPVDKLPAAAEALPTVRDLPLDAELIDLCREEFEPVVAVTGDGKKMRLQLERYTAIGALLRSAVASFSWGAIEPNDQRRTEQLLGDMRAAASAKEPKRARGKRGRASRAGGRQSPNPPIADCSIADVLRGLVVDCALTKDPKWRAISISVDFDYPRFRLPPRPKARKARHARNDPLSDRLRGINESGCTNLFRPWRG